MFTTEKHVDTAVCTRLAFGMRQGNKPKLVSIYIFNMSWRLAFLLAAITQVSAQSVTTTTTKTVKTVSQVPRSSSSVSANTIALPIDELQLAQSKLLQNIQQQTTSLQKTQSLFNKQIAEWSFASPSLRSTFEQSLSTVNSLFEQSNSCIQGADNLLVALKSTGGTGIQPEWIDRVRKLQGQAELALLRASESVASISRSINDFAKDQEIYAAAKQKQLSETKAKMDATLNNLMQQTVQIGTQASGVVKQGIKEWSSLLRQHLSAEVAQTAIAKLTQITQSTLRDLSCMRPEDIEMTMSDAHRCIDEVKILLHSSGVPAHLVRQAVSSVQLSMFAYLTKGRNFHF